MSRSSTDWARALRTGLLILGLAGAGLSAGGALAFDDEPIFVDAGAQSVFVPPGRVTRASVADPGVADVERVTRNQFLISGKSPGSTSLLIWLAGSEDPRRYRIRVGAPKLGDAGFGGAQVQIDVKIVELSRRALRQAGLNITRVSNNVGIAGTAPGSLSAATQSNGQAIFESASGFLPISQAFQMVYEGGVNGWGVALSVLENNGLAHTLAEPSLVALSGQTASFLAGGEFPIPVAQGSGNGTSITIEYKPFGVRLMVSPTVLDNDRIALKVSPEVSELDFTSGVTSAGIKVPGLVTRRADTMVEMYSGESFAISGLVSHSMNTSVDKVPGLGDIPILGAFFKSTRFDREDRELLMVVTPHLVRPLAAGAPELPLPGEEYSEYLPGLGELQLFERGHFDPGGAGFTR